MGSDARLDGALGLLKTLSVDIGPRRPCSDAERHAAAALRDWLRERGVESEVQRFRGMASGGPVYAAIFATALAGGLLRSRRPFLGRLLGAKALALAAAEADLRWTPVSNLFARSLSGNVVATVAAKAEERQRICLVGHVDTTRSGLVFHPAVIGQLEKLLALPVVCAALVAAGPKLTRRPAIAGLIASLALIAERELRGADVPGANDNGSGTVVVAQLITEIAEHPLEHTRVDLLITSCEESGLHGAKAYVRALDPSQPAPVFINFDTVGGDVPLTYLLDDGYALPLPASARLIAALERIAADRPELGLMPSPGTPGLPTDATVALAHGYEAVTLLAQSQDGLIPNYHWPTDRYENVHPPTIDRALEVGRELLAALDARTVERPQTGLLGNR